MMLISPGVALDMPLNMCCCLQVTTMIAGWLHSTARPSTAEGLVKATAEAGDRADYGC